MNADIKICGLVSLETIEAALQAGATMIGLVIFPKSPRHVSLDAAKALSQAVGNRAQRVALVVDADDDLLESVISAIDPDVLQLHGRETPGRVASIRARFGRPVMKAIGLSSAADLAQIPDYEAVSDRLLFDAKPAATSHGIPGGNGVVFDWTLLQGLHLDKPFMVSGGLTPQTVAAAIHQTRPQGVDVSSGVDRTRGEKDSGLIFDFVRAAQAAFDSQRTSLTL